MNQIGMTLDFGSSVKAVKEAGYDAIGTWFSKLEEYGYERGKEELLSSGLKHPVMCFLGLFNQVSESDYQEAREKDIKKLKQASDLGAEAVLAASGTKGNMLQEEAENLLVRSLSELAPVARELGVKIALEPIHHMYSHEWTYVTTLKQGLAIIDQVNNPQVGLMFDTYHLWQEPGLLDTLQEAKGKIFGCQINDWRPVTRSLNDRMVPGDGVIPLKTLVDAVAEAGFASWYDIEIFSDELWELEPKEFLDRCKKGAEEIWR